ncbi:MAG: TadE/TadG family type IV pilus assembly protein [Hyphomicrobiales bacterium]
MSLRASIRRVGSRIRGKLHGFAVLTSATAAIEFALVLPIMLTTYLGSVEVGEGVTADRKLSNLALTLANLTARSAGALQDSDLNSIFNAGAAVLAPFDYTQAGMVVTSIVFDTANPPNAYVVWSSATGPGATAMTPSCSANLSTTLVPNSIRTSNGSVILGQATFPYKPAIGYVVTGTINLSEANFMVPRNVSSVPRTNSGGVTYSKCSGGSLAALDSPASG